MLKSRNTIILIFILILGTAIRCWNFPNVPPGLNRDEAAIGYNAYSLLSTGLDEWGKSYPLVYKSFGDYKLPGYLYSVIPFVAILGLNEWAVRLPSLIAGILLIVAMYWITGKFTKNKNIQLLSAFLVAISPWAIHYSRVGFEANVALLLFVSNLSLMMDKKRLKYLLGLVLLFLSLLTYNAPLVLIVPFLFILMIFKKISFVKGTIAIALSALAFLLVFPATKGKTSITIFQDQGLGEQQRQLRITHSNSLVWRVVTNPVVYNTIAVAKNHLKSFSPDFLAKGGGKNPWHQAPGKAHLYYVQYVLALVGIGYGIISLMRKQKNYIIDNVPILLLWLFISPLASSITTDAPHATRNLFFFFLLTFFSALGIELLHKYKFILVPVVTIFAIELFHYLWVYNTTFLRSPLPEWNSGLKEAIEKAKVTSDEKMSITLVGDTHYNYIYPLFYGRVSPKVFRSTMQLYPVDALGFARVKSYEGFMFVESRDQLVRPTVAIQQQGKEFVVEKIE